MYRARQHAAEIYVIRQKRPIIRQKRPITSQKRPIIPGTAACSSQPRVWKRKAYSKETYYKAKETYQSATSVEEKGVLRPP
jgi:hypothetical protein